MKKWLVFVLIAAVAGSALADGGRSPRPLEHRPMLRLGPEDAFLRRELDSILAAEKDTVLGELTVGELEELLGELSIAHQKAAYVARSRAMSFMIPGLGQFMNKDAVSGTLFLTADLAVAAGALLGAYLLLPEELNFQHLNYFTAPYWTIKQRWEGQSFVDLLPTIGVLAGGGVLQAVLRGFSARHAAKLARRNIADGTVTFEPDLLLLPFGHAAMGFGMGMSY